VTLIEHGLFGPEADNWGYVMGGVYTVYMADSVQEHFDAVERALAAFTAPRTIRCFSA